MINGFVGEGGKKKKKKATLHTTFGKIEIRLVLGLGSFKMCSHKLFEFISTHHDIQLDYSVSLSLSLSLSFTHSLALSLLPLGKEAGDRYE